LFLISGQSASPEDLENDTTTFKSGQQFPFLPGYD
jgi:hypothetical protein